MLHALILGSAVAQVTPPPTPPPLIAPSPTPVPVATAAPLPQGTPSAVPLGSKLTVSPASVQLNPAQQSVLTIGGARLPLQATLDHKLVNVSVDAGTVTLTATQATGTDVLRLVDAAGARAEIPIRVAFNAGTILPQMTLRVTGDPVDPNWLAQQVQDLMLRRTEAMPGARVTLGTMLAPSAPLAPGGATQLTVPVQISGGGRYFDQAGSTVVDVQNVALDPFQPELLFYDDDPERVTQDGVLFRGSVTPGKPVRLYTYHDDDRDPRRLVVALSNDSQDPTSVQLVGALGGPNVDVLQVGDELTRDFLLAKSRNEGVIADLPQDEPLIVDDVSMSALDDVAGTFDIRVLSGGPVEVAVLAVSPGVDPQTLIGQPPVPGDGHARHGVFTLTGYGSDSLEYTAGGDDAQLIIGGGEPPVARADRERTWHDYGDYGVTHTIDVTLSNPSDAPSTAYLYFEPLGGVARGSFLIADQVVQARCVRDPVPYELAAYALQPHQTDRFTITTMTDGGSFYPVEIGVTGARPQPMPSQIDAPDGCFPRSVP